MAFFISLCWLEGIFHEVDWNPMKSVLVIFSISPYFSQTHLRCLGSRLVYFAAGGAIRKRRQGGRTGSDVLRSRAFGTGFQDKFQQCDCPEKLCAQDFPSGLQTFGDGTCIASLAGSDTKNALLLARVFQDKFHQYDCSEKLCAQGPRPAKVSKPWPMGHA